MPSSPNSARIVHFERSGIGTSAFDGGLVAVSINGGAFNALGSLGTPYNAMLSTAFDNPYGGLAVFSGMSTGYATLQS